MARLPEGVQRVNVDEVDGLAEAAYYSVWSVPCLLEVGDGDEVLGRYVGLEQVQRWIEEHA